jgi:hypothetical protein
LCENKGHGGDSDECEHEKPAEESAETFLQNKCVRLAIVVKRKYSRIVCELNEYDLGVTSVDNFLAIEIPNESEGFEGIEMPNK